MAGVNLSIEFATVQHWSASGAGNNGNDPAFADIDGQDNVIVTVDDDLSLTTGSPAIDSADAGVAGLSQDDHGGVLPFDIPALANTGLGTPAYADRGAHEYQDVAPVAALRVSPKSGKAPLLVTADGSSSTDNVGIVSYRFAFGDGSVVTQSTPVATHTYSGAGGYTIVLTVTDGAGFTSSRSAKVSVKRR